MNHQPENTILLALNNPFEVYQTTATSKYLKRKKWQALPNNEIRALIPGSTTKLLVKEGETLKQGSEIFRYEAMKMENSVCASKNCTIKKINIKVGESFPKGKVLVVFE